MENKIPTVKEFLSKNIDYVLENDCKEDVENAMIEFAKLHVEAAIKACVDNADLKMERYTDDWYIDRSSIRNAYPLTNIK